MDDTPRKDGVRILDDDLKLLEHLATTKQLAAALQPDRASNLLSDRDYAIIQAYHSPLLRFERRHRGVRRRSFPFHSRY